MMDDESIANKFQLVINLLNCLENVVFWVSSADYSQQLYLNPTYEKVWQRPIEELQEDPSLFLETLLLEDRSRFQDTIEERKGNPGLHSSLFRIRRPDGERRWIKSTSYSLINESENTNLIVGIDEVLSPDQWHTLLEGSNHPTQGIMNFLNTIEANFKYHSTNNLHEKSKLKLSQQFNLTPRQAECIHYLLKGYSAKQTAVALDLSTRTIDFYLNNLRRKLNCRSKTELIAKLLPYLNTKEEY